jgi:Rad3-related DNA helicase
LFTGRDSVVLTSATLALNGSFDYFRSRVGLGESRLNEVVLESPFDFLNQALLALPDDMPAPNESDFEERLVSVITEIAQQLGGRTLVLFTSMEQLGSVANRLRQTLAGSDIEVLAQGGGAGSRNALVERFKSNPEAVLCGTNSFWEGVDLPGRTLSCVVIVRLPFRPPSDPMIRARSERLTDPFLELALPEAVLRLKQGFGRLIRRATDRGAVVILDTRVTGRKYGKQFLESLPECAAFSGPSARLATAIREWIDDRAIHFVDEDEPGSEGPEVSGRAGAVRPDAG